MDKRDRFITREVKNKIDNFTQNYIWKDFVDPLKLKEDELAEFKLTACPFSKKQMIQLLDDLGRNVNTEECYVVQTSCNEEIVVIYDKDKNAEYMLLRSEMEDLTAIHLAN